MLDQSPRLLRTFLYGGGSALLLLDLYFLARATLTGNFVPIVPVLAGILTAAGLLFIVYAEQRERAENRHVLARALQRNGGHQPDAQTGERDEAHPVHCDEARALLAALTKVLPGPIRATRPPTAGSRTSSSSTVAHSRSRRASGLKISPNVLWTMVFMHLR